MSHPPYSTKIVLVGLEVLGRLGQEGHDIWPSPADGTVAITLAQLAYMLEAIDWRNPVRSWRPEAAGEGCDSLTRRLGAGCDTCDNPGEQQNF